MKWWSVDSKWYVLARNHISSKAKRRSARSVSTDKLLSTRSTFSSNSTSRRGSSSDNLVTAQLATGILLLEHRATAQWASTPQWLYIRNASTTTARQHTPSSPTVKPDWSLTSAPAKPSLSSIAQHQNTKYSCYVSNLNNNQTRT